MKEIKRILIANRGEIANRIIRSCHKRGIHTIAVFTSDDANASHARQANEAVYINSYLHINEIIDVALNLNCDAIHPGYGFLSENHHFAKSCEDNQLIFIGPASQHICIMGCKVASKRTMHEMGLPTLPSLSLTDTWDEATVLQQVEEIIGYPVIVKAAKGGGGKGITLAQTQDTLINAITSAQREAQSCFNDSEIFIEKYLPEARHIEVQIFGDHHGQVTHLFERNCSIQRRHQKLIEETPAYHLSQTLRENLLEKAVDACKQLGYVNAGTIEFLVDSNDFYFLEMNTRLQVEHPVTEMLINEDLVDWQLTIAEGKPLPKIFKVDDPIEGHAIEVRICAEAPHQAFLPQVGNIAQLLWPEPANGLRIDSGIYANQLISANFDSMMAKMIVFDSSRDKAIARMIDAIKVTTITGVKTNLDYLSYILKQPSFTSGHYHNQFLSTLNYNIQTTEIKRSACLLTVFLHLQRAKQPNPWHSLTGFQLSTPAETAISLFEQDATEIKLSYQVEDENRFIFKLPFEQVITVTGMNHNMLHIISDGKHQHANIFCIDQVYWVKNELTWQFGLSNPSQARTHHNSQENEYVAAPLPGKIVAIHCNDGEPVKKGQRLIVMEAMKMEHQIVAPSAATVKKVKVDVGNVVRLDQKLVAFTSTES